MRSRTIVAVAALIVVAALVVGTEPVGAQLSSPGQSLDPTQFRAVVIALPSESPTTSITPLDTANRSAGWLGPDTRLTEPWSFPPVPHERPANPAPPVQAQAQPKPAPKAAVVTVTPSVAVGGAWHFDGDISWYGPGFYGNRTACGLTLTKTLLGVANRTLPCGTRVTFRNPANGRTVTVPVVDRGPYVAGRTWDMTGGLCVYLDHCYTGSILWRLAGG